jgi:gamma-glutamyltranspeptidase
VKLERRTGQPTDDTLAALKALGHRIEIIDEQGHVCAIRIDKDGTYHGAADPRRYDGKAAGW